MTTRRRLPAAAVWLPLALACGGGADTGPTTPPPSVESLPVLTTLTVSFAAAAVTVGKSTTASVAAIDERGRPMSVGVTTWNTSQPSVATIGADGVIRAVSVGQTIVTAKVGTVQGQATIVVTPLPPGPVPVATVSVSPSSATLESGESMQLGAKPRDYAGNALVDRVVTWTSSEPTVATVSPTGLVTALGAGTAVVEATSEDARGAMVFNVTAAIDTDIVVSIMTPVSGAVLGDTVAIASSVRSLYPVTGVVAQIGGQQASLTFGALPGSGKPGWFATLEISTLPFGPYAIVISATDSRGHRGVQAVGFIRNPRVPGGSKSPAGGK
ncbi:MAG: Ig domain-containing protein [Gemmatimonadaceae bacterium]|nr:Ig domain-containing protein [Gemmatimonadaceae bacterium]